MEIKEVEIEIWKPIFGYEDYYQISNFGKIKSLDIEVRKSRPYIKKGKTLKINFRKSKNKDYGYCIVGLSKHGKTKSFYLHRLVAAHFVDNNENKKEVNHKDCNTKNNHYKNLEWVSPKENINHAIKNGRFDKWYDNASKMYRYGKTKISKLNKTQVIEIKKMLENNKTCKEIAHIFNVSDCCIRDIKMKRTWYYI